MPEFPEKEIGLIVCDSVALLQLQPPLRQQLFHLPTAGQGKQEEHGWVGVFGGRGGRYRDGGGASADYERAG